MKGKNATYRKSTCLADHRCSLCGMGRLAEREFAGGQSKWAEHEYVVFSKSTMEEPWGDCLKCETVFHAAGYADEFDSKEIRGTTRQ